MPLTASFSGKRMGSHHYFSIRGLLGSTSTLFLFDTGATYTTIGVNNFFEGDNGFESEIQMLTDLLKNVIIAENILPRAESIKTANNQIITTYPCICHNVSIEGVKSINFYFDISLQDFHLPLPGTSFSDDCSYNHTINGTLNITRMKESAGSRFYSDRRLLNFNNVVEKFLLQYPRFAIQP